MERQGEGRPAQPSAYSFVGQSGSKIDESTRGTIRSHAMKQFRNRQRQQRQEEQAAKAENLSPCRCLSLAHPSSHASEQHSQRQQPNTSSMAPIPPSERCCVCGKIRPLRSAPSQKMVALQQYSSPLATFPVVELLPVTKIAELLPSLTSKFSDEINAINAYAITFSPISVKSDIFPVACQMPGLLASILYMTYAHLSSARGWSNLELALGLKAAAISHINRKLSHPSTASCTNVVASISYLSTGTWIFGSPIEEMEMHLNGMELMVKQRGMDSLGVYQFGRNVRKYLFLQRLLMAAIWAHPITSTFDFDYNRVLNIHSMPVTKYESPLYCPQETLTRLTQFKRLSEGTLHLLYNVKALIDLTIDFDEGRIEAADFDMFLFNVKTELHRDISVCNLQSTSDKDSVFECCLLTALIMLEAIEKTQPLISSDPELTLALVRALEKTDAGDDWGELSGLLYWVSIVGAASSQGRPGHRLLDSTLCRTISEIAFTALDFTSAVEPIRRFSRLQMALKRRSQLIRPENAYI